jgi:hypothetical protein
MKKVIRWVGVALVVLGGLGFTATPAEACYTCECPAFNPCLCWPVGNQVVGWWDCVERGGRRPCFLRGPFCEIIAVY